MQSIMIGGTNAQGIANGTVVRDENSKGSGAIDAVSEHRQI